MGNTQENLHFDCCSAKKDDHSLVIVNPNTEEIPVTSIKCSLSKSHSKRDEKCPGKEDGQPVASNREPQLLDEQPSADITLMKVDHDTSYDKGLGCLLADQCLQPQE